MDRPTTKSTKSRYSNLKIKFHSKVYERGRARKPKWRQKNKTTSSHNTQFTSLTGSVILPGEISVWRFMGTLEDL